jgi:hypothetical protein
MSGEPFPISFGGREEEGPVTKKDVEIAGFLRVGARRVAAREWIMEACIVAQIRLIFVVRVVPFSILSRWS